MPSPTDIVLTLFLGLLGGLAAVTAGRVIPLFPRHDPDPDDDSGPPPPTCPHCGAEVPWPRWIPLPLRFLARAGCEACGAAVRSPAALWLAAPFLGLLALTGGERSPSEFVAFSFFAVWGVLLTIIDARVHRLPNRLVLTSYPVALVLLAAAAATTPGGTGRLTAALIGMAGLAAFYWVLWFIHPRGWGGATSKWRGCSASTSAGTVSGV
ncbi:prepilin peptidase [Allosalinactinospora lopnorensis]|uniref:prepilin peptidase n=1 Tax=Allosalinactinospora lopnorensis TaxID=1352348 RepID=UPI001F268CD5|nr:prepilin peptidase [Allosalinactinospora lopnorensis]